MSLLYMDGFDAQDVQLRWIYSTPDGSSSASTNTAFGSGYSLKVSPGAYGVPLLKKTIASSSQVFIGFRYNYQTASFVPNVANLYNNAGSRLHLYLKMNYTTYSIDLYLGSGTLLSHSIPTSPQMVPGSWYYVEMSATIGSAGTAEVRVDGNTVISYSGNTQNGGTVTGVDTVGLGGGSGQSATFYFDDAYICNSLGTVNNTFLGDVQVQTLLPAGAGSSTQLTPTGSASNYANVNDVPDSTSTYNSSTIAGETDLYSMTQLTAGTGTVYGVQQVTHAFKTTAGTGSIKSALQSGATVSYGATNALGTSNAAYVDLYENNPATGAAYIASDVDGLQAGAETV